MSWWNETKSQLGRHNVKEKLRGFDPIFVELRFFSQLRALTKPNKCAWTSKKEPIQVFSLETQVRRVARWRRSVKNHTAIRRTTLYKWNELMRVEVSVWRHVLAQQNVFSHPHYLARKLRCYRLMSAMESWKTVTFQELSCLGTPKLKCLMTVRFWPSAWTRRRMSSRKCRRTPILSPECSNWLCFLIFFSQTFNFGKMTIFSPSWNEISDLKI